MYPPGVRSGLCDRFQECRADTIDHCRSKIERPFNDLGWPAVRVTEPHENYDWQHKNVRSVAGVVAEGDVADNVDYRYLARVTGAVMTMGKKERRRTLCAYS